VQFKLRAFTYTEGMEHVAKSEPRQLVEAPARKQPLVFLDTDVIFSYLKGDASAAQLFSAEAEAHQPVWRRSARRWRPGLVYCPDLNYR